MPNDENRNIELDLDPDQPVEVAKVEGAWGLYEKAVEVKEAAMADQSAQRFVDLDIARPEGSAGLANLSGQLVTFDEEGNQLKASSWMSFAGSSSGSYVSHEVTRDGEALEPTRSNIGVREINRVNQGLLNELEIGETGTIAFKPNSIWLDNLNNYSQRIKDEDGDLANGIPIAEVTKIDEQLKRPEDEEVRFSTSWQSTGTNELVLDSTPLNGADFAQKLNALISTEENLGPFEWSNIRLKPTAETAEETELYRDIYLQLKDTDDMENVGIWSNNQELGASNQPNDVSEDYTYELSLTSSWIFREIYGSLEEGESADFEISSVEIASATGRTSLQKESERLDTPLKLTLLETNPNPTSSSLDLEGVSIEIDSEIALQTIFDERNSIDKSFIDSKNGDQQDLRFYSRYSTEINDRHYSFYAEARENEWSGNKLEEGFTLPWNSLEFVENVIESGVNEIELKHDNSNVYVDSKTLVESYSGDINGSADRSMYSRHHLPGDYEGDPINPIDPLSILKAPETINLTLGDIKGLAEKLGDEARPDVLRFGNYELSNQLLSLDSSLVDSTSGDAVQQVNVLGSQAERAGDYRIDITAESLSKVHNLEAVEVTIELDPKLFESINVSDVQISSQLPIQNAIKIDNEAGTVTLSGASLANLGEGSTINGDQALASIDLNFDNDYLETIAYNDVTGELDLAPVSFQMSVAEEEAVFSRDFTDASGQSNRSIQSLAELDGEVALNSDRVSLVKEIVPMEEESGLTLGTQRTIGVKGEFTNLVREGDTLEATTEWRNTGNTTVDGLQVEAIENENARLVDAQFSEGKESLESGRFVDGEWEADTAESTEITAKVEVTGKAGNVLDLSEGILGVSTETSDEVFENEVGSKNLITFQGDLNYDGRVSFKDLAYLNAGAARQELVDKVDDDGNQVTNDFGAVEQVATDESYASDVDANYDGKVSIADLSVLEKDWGKSLHTGDESFLGSGEKLDFESIDGDGTWDNSSFKRENAVAAEQIAEAQEAAAAVTETVDEGAAGGLSDSPVELKEDDGLLGTEL